MDANPRAQMPISTSLNQQKSDTEISDYAYERTLMMEQRGEIIKRLNSASQASNRKQSILLEQELDGGRLIRFRIRKPSIYDFEETAVPLIGQQQQQQQVAQLEMNDAAAAAGATSSEAAANSPGQLQSPTGSGGASEPLAGLRPDEANVRRMHTALSLNEMILRRSKAAKLIIVNLPGAPKESTPEAENNYMEFVEVLTDKLERVLLVQNGGREVITIHS